MNTAELTAIRTRAATSYGRGPDWDDFEALLNEVDMLRTVIRHVEWFEVETIDEEYAQCPWCDNYRPDSHRADCERQIALGIEAGARRSEG